VLIRTLNGRGAGYPEKKARSGKFLFDWLGFSGCGEVSDFVWLVSGFSGGLGHEFCVCPVACGQVLQAALPASGMYGALLGGHGANRRYGFAFLI
jgi:hypothetical protein